MKRALVCSILFMLLCLRQSQCASNNAQGVWSKEAVYLSYDPTVERIRVPSPDSGKAVTSDGLAIIVKNDSSHQTVGRLEGYGPPLEILWAPDSTVFALTWDDGGWVGTWRLEVFVISNEGVKKLTFVDSLKKDFMSKNKCDTVIEEPNMAALKWVDQAKKLVVIAEVPPHSTCKEMGKLSAYLVAIPSGEILAQYDEKEVRRRWGSYMGERIKVNPSEKK